MAIAGAVLGLLMYVLVAPPPRRRRKGPSVAQLQADRDKALRQATADGMAALGARAYARQMARDLQRFQWDGAFHQITDPVRAKRLLEACPQREQLLVRYSKEAQRYEASAAQALQAARERDKRLAKATREPRQQAGLVTLVRVCWQGWLVRHRKAVLY